MPDHGMPDFERRLEAVLTSEVRRRRRTARALTATAAATVTAATVVLMLSTGNGHLGAGTAQARAYPKIVYQPAATAAPSDLEIGVTDAQRERARPFPVGQHTGYAVPTNAGKWCLSLPDLASPQPDIERGVVCSGPEDLKRVGLSVRVGRIAAAAVAPGAPVPTRQRGKRTRPVTPDTNGIAIATDLLPGERFIVYGIDGTQRSHRAPMTEDARWAICEDGRRFDPRNVNVRDACLSDAPGLDGTEPADPKKP